AEAGECSSLSRLLGASLPGLPAQRNCHRGAARPCRGAGNRGDCSGRGQGHESGGQHQHEPGNDPLAHPARGGAAADRPGRRCRAGTRGATRDDARLVYQAILLASPGGIGRVDEQDVAAEPTMTLREVMALAADRDLIASQYASGFQEIFHEVLPMIRAALHGGHLLETAIIAAFLGTLARHPDSLILRKAGREVALSVSRKAAEVLQAGWPGSAASHDRLQELDAWLRSRGNQLNPGTTADLVTAALFAALRDGTIQLPRPAGPASWSVA